MTQIKKFLEIWEKQESHAKIVNSGTVAMRPDALQSPSAQRQIDALRRLSSDNTGSTPAPAAEENITQ
jgi:hypothetical protein